LQPFIGYNFKHGCVKSRRQRGMRTRCPFPSLNGTAVDSNLRGGRTPRTQIVVIGTANSIDPVMLGHQFNMLHGSLGPIETGRFELK